MDGECFDLKTQYRRLRNRIKNPKEDFSRDSKEFIELLEKSMDHFKTEKTPDKFQALTFDTLGCASKRMRVISNLIEEKEHFINAFNVAAIACHLGYFSEKQANLILDWKREMEDRVAKVEKGEHNALENTKVEVDVAPRRLRFAEAVLSRRTSQISIVLEKCYDSFNHQAVLRTVECLGIQNVYVVLPVQWKRLTVSKKVTKGNENYLSVKTFQTTKECIDCLRSEGRQIWATDLSLHSLSLESPELLPLPEKMALVIGREADGVSQEMLEAADRRVYLPIHGFSESLNLSVATAMVLQQLFFMCPTARGNLTDQEKHALRTEWYQKLAKNETQRVKFIQYIDHPPPPLEDLRRNDEQRSAVWVHKDIHKRIRDLEEETIDNLTKKVKSEELEIQPN